MLIYLDDDQVDQYAHEDAACLTCGPLADDSEEPVSGERVSDEDCGCDNCLFGGRCVRKRVPAVLDPGLAGQSGRRAA